MLGNALIHVAGRGQNQILAIGLVDAFGHEGRVKDNTVEHFFISSTLLGTGQCGKLLVKEILGKSGDELVHRVVVMDTVAKPHLLQVLQEGLIVLVFQIAFIIAINVLESLANQEVVLAVLVEQDVTAIERSLGQVIDQLLLLEGEFLKAGYLVTQHLDVGKAVHRVVKVAVLCHRGHG